MPHSNLAPAAELPQRATIAWNASLSTARPGVAYLREMVKLAFRAACHFQASREWIAYWNSSAFLSRLATDQPCLLKKIYRPYLFRQLDCKTRLAVLTFHYDFMVQHRLARLVARTAQAPVALAHFAGKSGQAYQLELAGMAHMEREGELVLRMVSAGVVLYSAAFTFIGGAAQPQLAVGCLQGGRAHDALERIRVATRDLSGLRPKTLLLRVLQQVGRDVDCSNLALVGNANRVMLQQIRKGRVAADYDGSWRELGASQQEDGNFSLACGEPAPPELATIASNKRSEAKKRHALVAAIANDVCAALRQARA